MKKKIMMILLIPMIYTLTRLTDHFSLQEFTRSATAIRHQLRNQPDQLQTERLRQLCLQVLEPLRCRFGVIKVTSGYRSEEVNRLVGGVADSQHMLGEAADIYLPNDEIALKMWNYVLAEHLPFDQMIRYRRGDGSGWLHISLKSDRGRNRYQAFCTTIAR